MKRTNDEVSKDECAVFRPEVEWDMVEAVRLRCVIAASCKSSGTIQPTINNVKKEQVIRG